MCGIFGLTIKQGGDLNPELIRKTLDELFRLSESRGKEAAGLAARTQETIAVYKCPQPASQLIKSTEYKKIVNKFIEKRPVLFIGHSRLATNGLQSKNSNNQPVVKGNLVGVHNGIVTNVENLFEKFPEIKREYQVDTEIILGLVQFFAQKENSFAQAVQKTFQLIEGSASVALLPNNYPFLALATNTGSLYFSRGKDLLVFASERYILERLIRSVLKKVSLEKITHLLPGQGRLINIKNLKIEEFGLGSEDLLSGLSWDDKTSASEIADLSPSDEDETEFGIISSDSAEKSLVYDENLNLKRCSRCLLPESFPQIEFDENGVCNRCRDYQKMEVAGEEELKKVLADYRGDSDQPDCLFPFSGGRDSSYGLHYIKNILKMNPVAYSYDWGMITDLARRNQARLCGQLGVEHILVSADIGRKRAHIRKNVLAWLKKPDLGMVPLFMAGDKQYFHYTNKLKKQTGAKLVVYSENPLEKTHFKNGFCGLKPTNDQHLFTLSALNKAKLALYFGRQYLSNPAYLNSSLIDTLGAYFASYFISHDYLFLYRYIKWDEEKIVSTLIDSYNWETAPDTESTWRIGDGTAPFYNYIYYTVAGFTENDTFRSNQIREGSITRQKALELVRKENRPRYPSLKWYADQINLDLAKTIKIINAIPKRYHENSSR